MARPRTSVLFAFCILLSMSAKSPGQQLCESEPLTLSALQAATVDRHGDRLYKKKGQTFPWECKCSKFDYRTFHLCLQARFFDPSARIYFDNGTDDTDEIDIFNNGGLNPTIDFVAVYIPWRLGRAKFFDSWSWGPLIGAGMSSAAEDAEDGTKEASDAPVVLFSAGLMLEYKFQSGPSFGVEVGKSLGFSSDEAIGNNDDDATYVGLKINIPIKDTKEDS